MEIRKQTQFSRVAWEQHPLRISRPYKWWYLFIPENETKKARVTLHFWNIAFSLPTRRRGMEQKWRGTVPDQFLRITIVFWLLLGYFTCSRDSATKLRRIIRGSTLETMEPLSTWLWKPPRFYECGTGRVSANRGLLSYRGRNQSGENYDPGAKTRFRVRKRIGKKLL